MKILQTSNDTIAKMLLDYRILNKLNQNEMALLLGCSQSQYSLWETGKINPNNLRQKAILEKIKEIPL